MEPLAAIVSAAVEWHPLPLTDRLPRLLAGGDLLKHLCASAEIRQEKEDAVRDA